MTKIEITQKSNSYKTKLIDCEQKIDKYNSSINTFSKFKAYLENSLSKVKDHKKFSLTFLFLCSAFSAISAFISIPVAVILVACSIGAFERLMFFNRVERKFKHCIDYITDVLENLSTKQLTYSYERDLTMEEIIKLEKTVPEVINSYLEEITEDVSMAPVFDIAKS